MLVTQFHTSILASCHYVTEIENAFKSNEGLLLDYEAVIRRMEENMMEYNEYILQKTEFYAVCQSGRRWGDTKDQGDTLPASGG